MSELMDLMRDIQRGVRDVEDVAAELRGREFPAAAPRPADGLALLASTESDAPMDPPGSFAEVATALHLGIITPDQYAVLAEAAAEPPARPPSRFYVIQDPGDPEPYALVAVRPRGLYEWWTDEGWVDTPYFAAYFIGGEIGAREISAHQVPEWQARIQKPSPGAVALMRSAP